MTPAQPSQNAMHEITLAGGSITPLVIIALLCAVGLAVGVRMIWRLRTRQRLSRKLADDRGTTTMEFAMVFPVVMFLALLLTQTMLLMGGQLFVQYAAFAATRTAVVQIGAYHDPANGEPQNALYVGGGSGKFERIRRTAEFALVPAAGRLVGGTNAPAQAYVDGLNAHFDGYNRDVPAWVTNLAAERLHYVRANTTVSLYRTIVHDDEPDANQYIDTVRFEQVPEGSLAEFGPREPITVAVAHQLNLSVPIVAVIFSDAAHTGATSSHSRYYTFVTAHFTLPNEGIVQDLPPRPSIDRIEPVEPEDPDNPQPQLSS